MDVVISNCVINLTPDKLASFKEIHRVLKPGGRILIADLVTAANFAAGRAGQSAAAWADCLAGAMDKEAYLETIRRPVLRKWQWFPSLLMRLRGWMSGCREKSSASKCASVKEPKKYEVDAVMRDDVTQISLGRFRVGIAGLQEAIEEVKSLGEPS